VGDPTSHRYRIDLVVEGMQGRLAVECDGDRWHGPERYDEDVARQRDLERAGWQFIRIRGGEFYRDRDRAMEALWRELDRLGIRPGGFDDAAVEPPPPAGTQDIEAEVVAGGQGLGGGLDDADIDADSSGADAPDDAGLEEANGDGRSESFGAGGVADEILADYVAFSGASVPDPRTVNVGAVADGLCQIIDVEGPMIAKRAYDIYLRGCGIKRLGGELKSAMNRALATAVRQGRVVSENAPGKSGLILSTVRSKGAPALKPRRRGPRSFDEIPSGELRAVGQYLSDILIMTPGSEEHLRAILESFDLRRLTPQVSRAILEALNNQNDDDPAYAGSSRRPASDPFEKRRA
jgi:hypothetical protein